LPEGREAILMVGRIQLAAAWIYAVTHGLCRKGQCVIGVGSRHVVLKRNVVVVIGRIALRRSRRPGYQVEVAVEPAPADIAPSGTRGIEAVDEVTDIGPRHGNRSRGLTLDRRCPTDIGTGIEIGDDRAVANDE